MTALPLAPGTEQAHVEPAQSRTSEPCVLLKLGEIVLKGRNRQQFEKLLQNNIRLAVADLGSAGEGGRPPTNPRFGLRLWQRDGVIVLSPVLDDPAASEAAELAADQIAERMLTVMGLVRVCRASRISKDPQAAIDAAADLARGQSGSFAVRAKRRDKRFGVNSTELAIAIGSQVQRRYGNPVNLRSPDFSICVEVDQSEVFIYTDGCAGQGGLPVGMSGRGLVLMSGGIDSPVAGYRMMRRGLYCSFLHFSGMPLTGPESVYKAYGLVRQLDRYQRGSKLFVVPFGKAQQRLASSGSGRLQIMAQRRLMLKTAQAMAARVRATALVTGDSLGQVSSQTLANITALDEAVDLPILRPLIGMDKTEIMAEARRIKTLALSELPDQDCCSLLLPKQVETKARVADLHKIEARLDIDELAADLAAAAQEYRPG
jgi:tRNA uracil 4-sulfurtransferase